MFRRRPAGRRFHVALSSQGEAHPDAAEIDGAVLLKARADEGTQYTQLVKSIRCRLGRLGHRNGRKVERRRSCPGALAARSSTVHALPCVAHVGQKMDTPCLPSLATAFAASMVEPARHVTWCATGGDAPLLADLCE